MSDNATRSTDVSVFNVPNVLTLIRLGLAIIVFCLIPLEFYMAGLVLFVVAASTDWVDGWYARRYQQVTKLGRILDPFVDKIIICGSFIMLAVEMPASWPWYARITGWIAVLVVGREMLVTALRGFIEQQGGDFSAMMSGKLKMVFQCAAVITSLWALREGATPTPSAWLLWSLVATIWLSVFSTVYSGIGYIFVAVKMVRN